ncbi:hypothetical protein [Mycobacterium terramassiliense]|uniref:Mycobacterium terramassiliense ORFan n=1 Tax=Mycobacterium terramassiliense TaxID=1841859 RepID=A0A2U3NKI2_9MYCO|nr:hypothetical protein [Mycobacterium terramassiliense]SPM32041.1 Mycobacterium terramassiliense ORFan [Mycobacterium terramassiliense]
MAFNNGVGNTIEAYTAGLPPVKSLSAASATNAASAVLDGVVMRTNSTLVVVTGTGVSAGDVEIEGSLDGTHWFVIGSPLAVSAASTVYHQTGTVPARYFRAVVSTAITGGTVDAWIGVTD